MAPIYSQKLFNAVVTTTGDTVVFTVPAGTTVVVTDIDVLLTNSAAGQVSFVRLGATALLYHNSAAIEEINQQWVGKQVLNAGDTITFRFHGTAANLAITGYVLSPT